nr:Sterol regulatory element-binding protein cleavage-activating protein, putative [Ipomoea batatas]
MAKEAMKTIIALEHPFLYLPKPIPSTQRISLLPHETARNPNFNRRRAPPMATGLVLVQILGTVKERGIWDVPNWVPILTIFVFLSASTLGVAYGALSASWVSDREGSALGFEEARRNWAEMWREEDDQNK